MLERFRLPSFGSATAGVFALVSAIITLIATKHGVGLAYDSINYLSAAFNFANGIGLRTGTLEPFTIAPPGLSLLLAPADWLTVDVFTASRYLGAFCFSATVVLTYVLLRRHVRSMTLTLLLTAAVALSPSLLFVMTLALTEPPFIVVCLLFILTLERIAVAGPTRTLLGTAIVLAWAGFMFRYMGLFMVPAGIASILLAGRAEWRRAIVSALVFAAGSLLVPIAWMARNHAADGTFVGPRANSVENWRTVKDSLFDTLGQWTELDMSVFGTALAVLAGVAFVVIVRSRTARPKPESPRNPLYPVVLMIVFYFAYLVYSELTTNIDPIDRRLMAPILVPLLLVLAHLSEVLFEKLKLPFALEPVFVAVAALFIATSTSTTIDDTKLAARDGIYLQSTKTQTDPQTLAVAELNSDALIYSNQRMVFWAVLRHEPARDAPKHYFHHSTTPANEIPQYQESFACRPVILAWFGPDVPGEFYSPSELAQYSNLKPVQTFPTGTNYEVTSLSAPGPVDCRKAHLRQ